MDNVFENDQQNQPAEAAQPNAHEEFPPAPRSQQVEVEVNTAPIREEPYRIPGAPRSEDPYRRSPYANSPYQSPYTNYGSQPQPAEPRYNAGQNSYTYVEMPRQPKAPRQKKNHPVLRTVTALVLTLVMVAGGCFVTAAAVNRRWEAKTAEKDLLMTQKLDELQQQIAAASRPHDSGSVTGTNVPAGGGMSPGQVYAQNVNSVVAITATIRTSNIFGQTTEGTSGGSGFILTSDGYVVTNYHVVEGATKISVVTHSGDTYTAKLSGHDSGNDVAVLKVEATNLPAVVLGSSDDLLIGDMVVAIGNPLGELASTQTVGYVSGKNREVSTDNAVINMIQTDAAINPGNSGGPLFNMYGEVVGITTAKYSGTTPSGVSIEGIGFAIPINDIAGIIQDLKNLGYVTGAYLGVTVQDVDTQSASMYGLPDGAYVVTVVSGGAAARAGVQPKDIITKLADHTVTSVTDLTRSLRSYKAGETVTLTVVRAGQTVELTVTLDERPQDLDTKPKEVPGGEMPSEGNFDDWYDYFSPFFGG